MNIYYGQYQGVSVNANLSMKGNMLMLSGNGSYRSHSDCYYEDQGLDCDNEDAESSSAEYIKIEYCPFCGKKLGSTDFEKKKTKDEIEFIKCKLKEAQSMLSLNGLHVSFSFKPKGENMYNRAKELLWKDFDGDCKIVPITLETILKEFGNLKARILYGKNSENYYYGGNRTSPAFDPKEGIKFDGSSFGEFYGSIYSITEEQYYMLVDMGLVKRNDTKVQGVKNKQAKIQSNIDKFKKKLELLKKKLKGYQNAK
jgi:hypothetical protein